MRPLQLISPKYINNKIYEGYIMEPLSGNKYPIINYIPRFVPSENYAKNFGYQWNKHRLTQYDHYSHADISQKRFEEETKWPRKMRDQYILEAGCGAGRFTIQAAQTEAIIISFDYSNAVDANYSINGGRPNVIILQANIYEMPFPEGFFDKIFCIGVLQHTPDPQRAFLTLVKYLKPGGSIVSDIYVKDITHWLLGTKYFVRHFTKNKKPEILYRQLHHYIDFVWPLAKIIKYIPGFGHGINWRLLVPDYSGLLPRTDEFCLKEWAYLDAFDMLSPAYDYPQTYQTFKKWHEKAGLINIDIKYGYNGLEGRATKPA